MQAVTIPSERFTLQRNPSTVVQGKNYKDRALAMLFLMNNLHYVVKAVESSPALSLVGQDWVEGHKDQVGSLAEACSEQAGTAHR